MLEWGLGKLSAQAHRVSVMARRVWHDFFLFLLLFSCFFVVVVACLFMCVFFFNLNSSSCGYMNTGVKDPEVEKRQIHHY